MTDEYIFKFGQFKHKSIDEVPNWYLYWIVENFDEEKQGECIYAADKEIAWRKKNNILIEN